MPLVNGGGNIQALQRCDSNLRARGHYYNREVGLEFDVGSSDTIEVSFERARERRRR